MKAWFISDLHLKSLNERNGNILLRFLFSLMRKENTATHLFLLGDIFDFWVGDQQIFSQKFKPIVESLIEIKKMGIEVFYVEGNHDVHVEQFWKNLGISAFVEDQYFALGPWQVRVSHGDLMNPEDKAYLRFRDIIRSPFIKILVKIIPARQAIAIGDWVSRTSRKKSKVLRKNNEVRLREMIHAYAEKCHEQKPYDFLISGHMHIKDEWTKTTAEKKFTSINLGSWFEQPAALWLDESKYGWLTLS